MDEKLFKTIHERARLRILTYLASKDDSAAAFNEIKDRFAFTAGNLSIQLRNLEEAGLVEVEKTFSNRRPLTNVVLTVKGKASLLDYIGEMERMFENLR